MKPPARKKADTDVLVREIERLMERRMEAIRRQAKVQKAAREARKEG